MHSCTFWDYQDMLRDTFLLAKLILATGGLTFIIGPQNASSMFPVTIILCTISMLFLPMLLSSIQTAMETPGLPLGMATISPGWKKNWFKH